MRPFLLTGILLAGLMSGCVSLQDSDPKTHPARLRSIFPTGRTSSADVLYKFRPLTPDISIDRPDGDWSGLSYALTERVSAAQKLGKRPICRSERYDGQYWFFYDKNEILVDMETNKNLPYP